MYCTYFKEYLLSSAVCWVYLIFCIILLVLKDYKKKKGIKMDCNYSIKIDITMQPQFITIEWRISVDDAADETYKRTDGRTD